MTDVVWVRVTAAGSVPIREGRAVVLGGRDIALFNLGDRFLATDNRCPHQGGPLCDGIVTGHAVVCPLHAWKIDLETGGVLRPAAQAERCVQTYPTRLVDGIVLIGLPHTRGRDSQEDSDGDGGGPGRALAATADRDFGPPLQGS